MIGSEEATPSCFEGRLQCTDVSVRNFEFVTPGAARPLRQSGPEYTIVISDVGIVHARLEDGLPVAGKKRLLRMTQGHW